MLKCICPNCNEKTISVWTKFFLQPSKIFFARDTTVCKKCGKTISVPYWSVFFKIIYTLAFIFGFSYFSDFLNLSIPVIVLVSFLSYVVIYTYIVPLIIFEKDEW